MGQCLNTKLPYIQNMIKAVGSEVLTSKALSEFSENYNPTIPEVLAVIDRMKPSLSEAQLDKRFSNFLAEHGINVERSHLGEGVRGQVDFMHKLVKLSNGENVGETFIEEGSHVLVELLRQNNSSLYQSMYSDITKYPIYQDVVKTYGDVYKDIFNDNDYISKERQLKDEAIGKLIAQTYLNRVNGSEPQITRAVSWLGKVKEWLRNLLPVTTNQFADAFNLTVDEFIKGGFKKLRPFKSSDVLMYSLEPTKGFDWQNVKALILDRASRMTKKIGTDEKGNEKEYYFFDGKQVKTRVTEQVKDIEDDTFSEEQREINKKKSNFGTIGHNDIENILNRYVEKQNGVKNENLTPRTTNISQQVYGQLEIFVHNLLANDIFDGAEILTEVKLYDASKDMGGTVDVLILDKTGKAHIFDWKFTSSLDHTGKKKDYFVSFDKKKQWKAQLALYRDILQKQYGVKEFGQTRMIPFGVEYTKDGEFISVEIDSNKYLDNVVPSDEETTGNVNLDRLISQLKRQYKELKEKTKFTDENAKERLKYLNKAIDDLRVKKDMAGFIKNATFEMELLDKVLNKDEVTDAEIREIINKLDFYKNLSPILSLDPTAKLKLVIDKAIELEAKFYGEASKGGKFELWKATNKVSYKAMQVIGSLYKFSTLQQINNPLFNLLAKKTTLALDHKENRMRELKDRLIELKGKLTTGYDRLLAKDENGKVLGTQIRQFNNAFYSELTGKDDKWLEANITVRNTIIADGVEVNTKEHFEADLATMVTYHNNINPDTAAFEIEKYRKKFDMWNPAFKPYALKYFQEKGRHRYAEPSSNWHSKEYKWLIDNPTSPEAQMYDIFQKILLDAREVADTGIAKHFIPSVKKSALDRAIALDGQGMIDAAIDSVTMDDYIVAMEENKSLKLILPKELGAEKDLDLATVFLGFADRVYHSKYLKDVEDIAFIGKTVLNNGEFIQTDKFGKPKKENGVIVTVNANNGRTTDGLINRTLDAYDEFVDAIIYSTDDGKDIKLFTLKGKAVSGKKTLSALIEHNAITALGGNLLSGTANLIGAVANQIFLRIGDTYFNKDTFKSAHEEVAGSIFNHNSKAMKVMTLFDINSTSNLNKWQKQVAINPANKVSKDMAFFIQQGGDHVTQNAGLIAFLKSSTINERGRVVRITDTEVQKNIYDGFVVNGDDISNTLTQEQVNYIRNKVREINTEVTGSLSDRDKLGIKQTTFGRMFTQFKTFAIPMGKARVGQLYYNANLDEYKEGRFKVATAVVFNEMFKPMENLKYLMSFNISAIKGNFKEGLEARYKELIELNPNFDPNLNPETGLDFPAYLEMTKRNLKTALIEFTTAMSIFAMIILASYYDDDDEEGSATQKFLAETLIRTSRELTFWFNPTSLMDFVSDTPIPVMGLITRTGGFFKDSMMEGFGLVYGDDDILETAKPVKKGISILPFGKLINQVISLTSEK